MTGQATIRTRGLASRRSVGEARPGGVGTGGCGRDGARPRHVRAGRVHPDGRRAAGRRDSVADETRAGGVPRGRQGLLGPDEQRQRVTARRGGGGADRPRRRARPGRAGRRCPGRGAVGPCGARDVRGCRPCRGRRGRRRAGRRTARLAAGLLVAARDRPAAGAGTLGARPAGPAAACHLDGGVRPPRRRWLRPQRGEQRARRRFCALRGPGDRRVLPAARGRRPAAARLGVRAVAGGPRRRPPRAVGHLRRPDLDVVGGRLRLARLRRIPARRSRTAATPCSGTRTTCTSPSRAAARTARDRRATCRRRRLRQGRRRTRSTSAGSGEQAASGSG